MYEKNYIHSFSQHIFLKKRGIGDVDPTTIL